MNIKSQADKTELDALAELSAQADPIANELLNALSKMSPTPDPAQAIMACRMVAMCAGHLLLHDGADSALIQRLFDVLDAHLNIGRVISGEITVGSIQGARARAATPRPEDAAIFDIDNWEKGNAP